MKVFNPNISPAKSIIAFALFLISLTASAQSQALVANGGTDPSEKVKVDVFPNPTSDFLNIDLSKLNLQKPQLEIRSIIGTKMSVTVEGNGPKMYKVDVQSFPRGYYLVLVRDDRSKFQQTIRFSKK